MVTVRTKQRIWEVHEYELSPDEFKEFKKLSRDEKLNFLDNIGGTAGEYEGDIFFKFEVVKNG